MLLQIVALIKKILDCVIAQIAKERVWSCYTTRPIHLSVEMDDIEFTSGRRFGKLQILSVTSVYEAPSGLVPVQVFSLVLRMPIV